jgi:glycosyltransferase involved in cell wall biosynthesis
MKKKRILFFDHTAKLSGGERSLLLILKKLNIDKFEPILALPQEGPLLSEAKDIGIETEIVPVNRRIRGQQRKKIGFIFLVYAFFALVPSVFKLLRLVRKNNIDIIYTNSQKAHLIGLLLGFVSRTPVIWHFRDILNQGYIRKIVKFLGITFTTQIIAISRAVAHQFEIAGRASDKVKVIYNAIDWSDFEDGIKNSKTDLRLEFGLPKDAHIVATVGQIARWKGQEYIIFSGKRLIRKFDNLYFFIVGKPLFKESEYQKSLHNMVKENGLEDKVFFTGYRWDIPGVMNDIDILLHTPTEAEPFGRVLIEAMVAGTPVIGFRTGAMQEIIRGETGFLVTPGSVDEIVDTVSLVIENRDIYKSAVKRAREMVKNRFDYQTMMRKIENIICE